MSSKGRRNAAFNNSKIIRSITNSEPLGKNTSEIALDTGINRTTVTRRCKQLVKDRYLTDKEHKHGKYHITEKVYGDPKLQASIFAGESIRGIFHGFLNYLPIKNEDSASKDSLLLENKFWTSLEEIISSKPSEEKKALLNFAMKVGVQILYAMIEAIHKHSPKLALGKNEIGQASIELKGIEKDRLTQIWVKNAINPLAIFREFVKLPVIRRGLAISRQIPQYKNKELVKEIHKSRIESVRPRQPHTI